jgi:hypothetical protein
MRNDRTMRTRARRAARAVGVVALTVAAMAPTSGAQATAAPYCGITWGSAGKQDDGHTTVADALTGVRAGRHACFDRLVLDGASWARVRYVDAVREDGSGRVVPLRGGARLEIITTRSDDVATGRPTYTPADPRELVDVAGWRTFRQAAFAGDFEGRTTLGLGVRARLPFRVFVLTAPGRAPRVVLDVAHRW